MSGIYLGAELFYRILLTLLYERTLSACVARAPCGLWCALAPGGDRFRSTPYPYFLGPLHTGSDDAVRAGVAPR